MSPLSDITNTFQAVSVYRQLTQAIKERAPQKLVQLLSSDPQGAIQPDDLHDKVNQASLMQIAVLRASKENIRHDTEAKYAAEQCIDVLLHFKASPRTMNRRKLTPFHELFMPEHAAKIIPNVRCIEKLIEETPLFQVQANLVDLLPGALCSIVTDYMSMSRYANEINPFDKRKTPLAYVIEYINSDHLNMEKFNNALNIVACLLKRGSRIDVRFSSTDPRLISDVVQNFLPEWCEDSFERGICRVRLIEVINKYLISGIKMLEQ